MPVEIFYSYAHNDEALRDRLEKHLATLKNAGVITGWHDRRIPAGTEWDGQINEHLNSAEIILLLVSVDFLASTYCTDIEVKQAMARHEAGTARVIPIILHPCDWMDAPFGKLQGLPKDATPISLWANQDEAFLNVVQGIRAAIADMAATTARPDTSTPTRRPNAAELVTSAQIPDFLVVEFVARRDEDGHDIITRLRDELAPVNQRLVVLWGAGGVGKTTLAAEAARALIHTFAGRIVWTSALGRADYTRATLLDEIATQLGHADLRQLAPEPKAAAVRALLAEAPTLVILDNFEDVTETEQCPCADFLHNAPASALITTRQKIDDKHNVLVDAMSLEEARPYLQLLIKETNDRNTFAQLDHDHIINTAARNPLVMQWVVAQIDAALDPTTVLDDLTHGIGDAAERVFTRSFNLPQLTADGRAALLALALFTPDASRKALAKVAGFKGDVLRLNKAVKRLAALWLVKTTEVGTRLALEGLTRQLALARLRQDAHTDNYRRRFVSHFLRHAEAHEQETPEAYDALEAEQDNLLAAMDVAEGLSDWPSIIWLARALASPMGGVLSVRGYWDEALRRGEQGARAAEAAGDEGEAVKLAGNAATVRMERGDYEAARQVYEWALAVLRRRGEERSVAVALHQLGRIAKEQGEYEMARQLYGESLEITRKLDDQRSIAITTWNIGNIALKQGALDEAGRLLQDALKTLRSLQDQINVAGVLHQLGRLAQAQGDLAEARRLYDESLEINTKLGDQSGIASTLHQLGWLAQAQGELGEARRLYNESLEIRKKLGDQHGIAGSLHQSGLLAEKEGDSAEAVRLLREALSIFERLKSPSAEIARRNLAWVEAEGE
ncbi:MAG: tetratricopeptide repeat protein [Pyrinomonadaceae bacterium]